MKRKSYWALPIILALAVGMTSARAADQRFQPVQRAKIVTTPQKEPAGPTNIDVQSEEKPASPTNSNIRYQKEPVGPSNIDVQSGEANTSTEPPVYERIELQNVKKTMLQSGTIVPPDEALSDEVTPSGLDANLELSPPRVVSSAPPKGYTVGVDEPMTITFSQSMEPNSVKNAISLWGWFIIPKKFSSQVQAVGSGNRTFKIVAQEPLVPNAAYVIKVAQGVAKDFNGTPLADAYSWDFYINEYGGCPPPQITQFDFTKSTCTYHYADECDKGVSGSDLEGDCDTGFSEGEIVVTNGIYQFTWATANVAWIEDDCGHLVKDMEGPEFENDGGEIAFYWHKKSQKSEYKPPLTDYQVENYNPHYHNFNFRGGRFDCNVVAHGACGQTRTMYYWYSCD